MRLIPVPMVQFFLSSAQHPFLIYSLSQECIDMIWHANVFLDLEQLVQFWMYVL